MTTVLDIQRRLSSLGFNPGPADGLIGPATLGAMMDALDTVEPPEVDITPVPVSDTKAKAIVAKQPKVTRAITEIIIHCTATPEGRPVSVDAIRSWHRAQGWNDIGYHYVVGLDGAIEPGRPEAQIGAHVAGHNTGTLGVTYVGGVARDGKTAKDTRTDAQRAALIDLVKALIAKYPTVKKISGHRDYANKACPSFDVHKDPLGKLL